MSRTSHTPHTIGDLARSAGCTVAGDPSVTVTGAASIEDAGPGDITFISDPSYARHLETTKASAVILREGTVAEGDSPEASLLLAENPQLAFARVLAVIHPPERPEPGVHPRAEVHPEAKVAATASVGPFCVVEKGAGVGERAVLYPGVYVGRDSTIGADTVLHAGVKVRERCTIGERVEIHCNAVIGSDGFGYAHDGKRFVKIPQVGTVRIEDDAEIGASTTIDRAALGETVIGRGVKIDNLVQIAHNVTVGENTAMAAQVGIAGSAKIGSGVQLGGQAGVAGHIRVGDGVMAGAKAGLHGNIPGGRVMSGYPAFDHKEWLKSSMITPKLPELRRMVRDLEKRVRELEKETEEER